MVSIGEPEEITPLLLGERNISNISNISSTTQSGEVSLAGSAELGHAGEEEDSEEKVEEEENAVRRRTVKLGRKLMPQLIVAHHWAVKIGEKWYEISIVNNSEEAATLTDVLGRNKNNRINTSIGRYAKSGAGYFGGGVVGVTEKRDREIVEWCETWQLANPVYRVTKWNCQKFAVEFIEWLTGGNWTSLPRINAGEIHKNLWKVIINGLFHIFSITTYLKLVLDTDILGCLVSLIILWCLCGLFNGIISGISVVCISNVRGIDVMVPIMVGINVYIILILIGSIICHGIYWLVDDSTYWFKFIILNFWVTDFFSGIATVGVIICYKYWAHDQEINQQNSNYRYKNVSVADGGNFIASYGLGQYCASCGPVNMKFECLSFTMQAVSGPGIGIFIDFITIYCSFSMLGNLFGWRVGSNANTGIGIRNGNFEAHLLGLGGKIGTDGVEINTPFIGINACCIL